MTRLEGHHLSGPQAGLQHQPQHTRFRCGVVCCFMPLSKRTVTLPFRGETLISERFNAAILAARRPVLPIN